MQIAKKKSSLFFFNSVLEKELSRIRKRELGKILIYRKQLRKAGQTVENIKFKRLYKKFPFLKHFSNRHNSFV